MRPKSGNDGDDRSSGWLEWLHARSGPLVAAWMLPVLAWGVATLYLGGALGKNTDDYSINLRDPATGALPTPFDPWVNYPYFIRPLHTLMCFGVGTLWPDADRAVHVVVAVMHGLAGIGLWLLLRRMTCSRLAAAAGALLFVLMPVHGEVAFWFCTTSTAIGAAMYFAAALVAMRFASAEREKWWLLGVVFVLMLGVACFYEQSAALAAGLPLVCLGAAAGRRAWRERWARTAAVTMAAGLGCALYVALLVKTAPEAERGGAESFVKSARVGERAREVAQSLEWDLIGERARELVSGEMRLGAEVLSSPKGLVVGAWMLAAGILWVVWAARRGGVGLVAEETSGTSSLSRPAWLLGTGVVTFFAALLPIYVIDHQIVEMRNTYVPLIGVAMVIAGLLDVVMIGAERAGRGCGVVARAVVGVCVLGLVGIGTVGLLGYQAYFRQRAMQDEREISTLKEWFPNPPPNTLFVPLRTGAIAAHSGMILFDRARYGVFETPWSADAAMQWALHRDDVGATACNPWMPPPRVPVDKPDAEGVRWTKRLSWGMMALFPADPEGGRRIPWRNMVPFVTRADGQVELVRRVDVERADHRDLEIRPPLVRAVIDSHKDVPTTTFRMVEGESEKRPDLIPLKFWEYADGKGAEFIEANVWNTPRRATWLAADAGARASMSISMPPQEREEYLLLRASIGEYDLNPKRHPVARVQELVVTMASEPEKVLGVLRLDPANLRGLKKWLPLVVTLPARKGAGGDRIVVTLRLTNDPSIRTDPNNHAPIPAGVTAAVLPVWVTPGYEQAKGR